MPPPVTDAEPAPSAGPDVSFVVAAHDAARHLEAALGSALAQTGVSVEVLVIDDRSRDHTHALALEIAARDARVRVFQTPRNAGPGGARNIGLDAARGRWIAVLDADDLIHPDRSRRLIAAAETGDRPADILADDLLVFLDEPDARGRGSARRFLPPEWTRGPADVDLDAYLARASRFGAKADFGFLKPMIRRSALGARRYNERLRVGEDSDLMVRLLVGGARLRIVPELTYFYRKHAASISHRLSTDAAERMVEGVDALEPLIAAQGERPARHWRMRRLELARQLALSRFVAAAKARDLRGALDVARATPAILPLLSAPALAAVSRIGRRPAAPRPARPDPLVLISRGPLPAADDPAFTRTLAVAQAARAAGAEVRLVHPCPGALFADGPIVRLPSGAPFTDVRACGATRIGDVLFARDASAWARPRGSGARPPIGPEEIAFLARHGRTCEGRALFATEADRVARPYLLSASAQTRAPEAARTDEADRLENACA